MNLDIIVQQLGCHICGELTRPFSITGVCIDSRKVQPRELFIALRGERFDGHDFIGMAVANGAAAVLCERPNQHFNNMVQLVVPDSLQALTTIARHYRNSISCPIIALTGSNGKTTVKEMIAAILPKPAFATFGNLNNHIGVPLSVLQLQSLHRYAVFELGANHPKEIAHTVAIVQPHITLINNIAPAHIEGFGSINGVAEAKGEIHAGLSDTGAAIVNEDDEFSHFWDVLLSTKRVIRFSLKKAVDVRADTIVFNDKGHASFNLILPVGNTPINLRIPGKHSVQNALAAAACCYAAGINLSDIANGLNSFAGVAGRMTYRNGKNQSLIIDDTYNANLRSVLTAIDVLAYRQGMRILVLGDMGELGVWTRQHHEDIGAFAQQRGIDLLMTCGTHSKFSSQAFGTSAKHYSNQEELVRNLLPKLSQDTVVLVKGSRLARMENIVHQIVSQ